MEEKNHRALLWSCAEGSGGRSDPVAPRSPSNRKCGDTGRSTVHSGGRTRDPAGVPRGTRLRGAKIQNAKVVDARARSYVVAPVPELLGALAHHRVERPLVERPG